MISFLKNLKKNGKEKRLDLGGKRNRGDRMGDLLDKVGWDISLLAVDLAKEPSWAFWFFKAVGDDVLGLESQIAFVLGIKVEQSRRLEAREPKVSDQDEGFLIDQPSSRDGRDTLLVGDVFVGSVPQQENRDVLVPLLNGIVERSVSGVISGVDVGIVEDEPSS